MRHCALNVALYGPRKRWAMTERRASAVQRGPEFLTIGPSALNWDGATLTVEINELAVPFPRRLRGTLRLYPTALETTTFTLDSAGHHRWQPIAPCARAELTMDSPNLSWSGQAYFDTNTGDRPLEQDFVRWDWSRARIPGGTAVLYEIQRRDGPLTLAMRYDDAGGRVDLTPPTAVTLPATRWRVPRRISATAPSITKTLEDTPFYARSVVAATIQGHKVSAMHESLAMSRFTTPWVQAMLPFRMPRV